jgi:hypothetical protein
MCIFANSFDLYLTDPWDNVPPDDQVRGCNDKCWFVWGDESDGWIFESDLPPDKQQALQRRMEREPPNDWVNDDPIPF